MAVTKSSVKIEFCARSEVKECERKRSSKTLTKQIVKDQMNSTVTPRQMQSDITEPNAKNARLELLDI
eukprot:2046578-Karenia_brevis.AAC.1